MILRVIYLLSKVQRSQIKKVKEEFFGVAELRCENQKLHFSNSHSLSLTLDLYLLSLSLFSSGGFK